MHQIVISDDCDWAFAMYQVLVLNPNSSQKVTHNLRETVSAPSTVELSFYTAPSSAPEEITGEETSRQSEKVVLDDLKDKKLNYDGILVCCYSDHPLVRSLAKLVDCPVMGIMQATLLYALLNGTIRRLFVLTSVSEWLPLLDKAIVDFVGAELFPSGKFQKTRALDVNVTNLSDPEQFAKIEKKVSGFLDEYKNDNIDCVLLGCAGMAGLDKKLAEKFPLQFIDSVKIGVDFLTGLMQFKARE